MLHVAEEYPGQRAEAVDFVVSFVLFYVAFVSLGAWRLVMAQAYFGVVV